MREWKCHLHKKRCRQAGGTLCGHLLTFSLPFLPSLPFHAEPTIPGTPAVLLRSRNRRGCQGECTGRCVRFRAAEYRNCWLASSCGPSWLFPPVRYEILRCSCGWADDLLLTAWLLSQETENAGACQATGLMCVCIFLSCIISHWERVSIAWEGGCNVEE